LRPEASEPPRRRPASPVGSVGRRRRSPRHDPAHSRAPCGRRAPQDSPTYRRYPPGASQVNLRSRCRPSGTTAEGDGRRRRPKATAEGDDGEYQPDTGRSVQTGADPRRPERREPRNGRAAGGSSRRGTRHRQTAAPPAALSRPCSRCRSVRVADGLTPSGLFCGCPAGVGGDVAMLGLQGVARSYKDESARAADPIASTSQSPPAYARVGTHLPGRPHASTAHRQDQAGSDVRASR
jgi:hypothetical protein